MPRCRGCPHPENEHFFAEEYDVFYCEGAGVDAKGYAVCPCRRTPRDGEGGGMAGG